MSNPHNHPPLCCCLAPPSADPDADVTRSVVCPACPQHGELSELRNVVAGKWHQTGDDEAHERWQCSIAACGLDPDPALGDPAADRLYAGNFTDTGTLIVSDPPPPLAHFTIDGDGEVKQIASVPVACSRPGSNRGDGRGCTDPYCPRHGEPADVFAADELPDRARTLTCPHCGLVDDHKGGCPATGQAPAPGAPG